MHPVTPDRLHPLLQQRFSTRLYRDQDVDLAVLVRLFEAARWSASSSNEQPWRFVVAIKSANPEGWEQIASTLVPGNAWALQAPVLGISIASPKFARNDKPNRWAQFDTGAAMAMLTVQATAEGLNVHQMGGFDAAKAIEVLGIPEDHTPMAAFAIGYAQQSAPPDGRTRKPLDSILFDGAFGNPLATR
jgi:nitroreductase